MDRHRCSPEGLGPLAVVERTAGGLEQPTPVVERTAEEPVPLALEVHTAKGLEQPALVVGCTVEEPIPLALEGRMTESQASHRAYESQTLEQERK